MISQEMGEIKSLQQQPEWILLVWANFSGSFALTRL